MVNEHIINVDRDILGRFVKGIAPWNKGTKGIMKSNVTSFKKGNKPINWKPVGTILKRTHKRDGERNSIKIAEPSKWEEYAKYLWKKEYGFLLKGDVVHHINGNKLNDKIENLIAFPRKDHPKFHNRYWLKELTEEQIRFYKLRYEKDKEYARICKDRIKPLIEQLKLT